ncbi:MAG: pyrroline-5-carboxylate reductase [Gammaproteobacteria bacterium]|nr:MAG: pyrroline-5-carboxylate reductase [Gammaproteobacteria bacterium]
MKTRQIAFIGGGNMARSLIAGLISDGCEPANIHVSDPHEHQRQSLQEAFSVNTTSSNTQVLQGADVVVLAVKPQILRQVIEEIADSINKQPLLMVSIVAGIRIDTIQNWLGGPAPLVRTMPNTPAMVQTGATGLFANREVSDEQRELAESIMRAVGVALWLDDEELIDAVTALSGSGPAYFFLVMEAMINAGQSLGLSAEVARLLTLQTALGAARLAIESDADPATLRQRVTSPGGTTERAIASLRDAQLEQLFRNALTAARDRAREISDQLGDT